MKQLTSKFLMVVLAAFILLPVKAQLINQFKTDDASISFVQFPTQKEKKATLTYEMVMESVVSKAVDKVVKNEAIANAMKTGLSVGKESELPEIKGIIPFIFPTDGDLHAEIIYSPSKMGEDFLNMERVMYNYVNGGTNVEVIAAFKVYSMPGKKLIYTQDKRMVEGYVKKSSSSSAGSSMGGMATAADQENIARRWALDQIRDMYGLRSKYHAFPVYRLKKLDGDVKDRAKDVQDKFVELTAQWDGKNKSADFQKDVKECMAHWEGLLKQHKPGTEKQGEALVTDNNVWCLQHNLAIGHLMLGQKKQAMSLINKAVEIRKPEVKEITNKSGKKVGEASGIQNNEDQAVLAETRRVIKHYFEGVENMKPAFVDMVMDDANILKASRLAREVAANFYISSLYDLNVPTPFVSTSIAGEPKLIKGEVNDVNYSIKKQLLYFLTKSHTMKMNGDGIATKQILGRTYLPASVDYCGATCSNWIGNYDAGIYFASGVGFRKAKDLQKNKYLGSSSIQYDWNGDILINNYKLNDNALFMFFMDIKPGEALGVKKDEIRVKHDNFEVKSFEVKTSDIERERDMSFFEAWIQKIIAKGSLLETSEISNESVEKSYTYSSNKLKIKKDGKTSNESITIEKDDKGNWTVYKVDGVEAQRTFQYE